MPRGSAYVVGGAIWGALGVALGAFGAHALRDLLSAEQLAWWETGTRYHLLHAGAVVLAGLVARDRRSRAGALLLLGSLVFSGSLYGLACGGPRALGVVTPFGGLGLMAGWVALAWEGRRLQ